MTQKTTAAKTTDSKSSVTPANAFNAAQPSRSPLSPQEQLLQLHIQYGNRAVQKMYASGRLQAKLKIGQPGDKYEVEADRVADRVMGMPDPQVSRQENDEDVQAAPFAERITPLVQRETVSEEEEESAQAKILQKQEEEELQTHPGEDETAQAKANSSQLAHVSSAVEGGIQSLRGGGQPLSAPSRAFFEPRLGADLSRVRVHHDSRANHLARSISAKAFTLGRDVVFGAGQYQPESSDGKRLMAHELTHVVQQSGQTFSPKVQRWPRDVQTEIILDQQRRARVRLSALEGAIDRYAVQFSVPASLLRGIIHYETLDRGVFETAGEIYKIARRDWTVSLGPGDVQVRRAAEILHPGRNWTSNPLTDQEFNTIVGQLSEPDGHARILAETMQDNFSYYGRRPGKTVPDRWHFATAKHKAGHGGVGNAQARAGREGRDSNTWSDVSQYMNEDVVEFANNAYSYSGTRLRNNPYG